MKKILIFFCVPLLFLTGCIKDIPDSTSNDGIEKKYGLTETTFPLHSIKINEIIQLIENEFNGIVFFSRSDCQHCVTALTIYTDVLDNNDVYYEELYIIETDLLTEEDRKYIGNEFSISVVPTLVKFEKGEKIFFEMGVMPPEDFLKFMNQRGEK